MTVIYNSHYKLSYNWIKGFQKKNWDKKSVDIFHCAAAGSGHKTSVHQHHNSNPPKLTAERRRDHLHLMRRRKSRARLLTNEELHKLQHFRKFLHGIGPLALIHQVLDIRRHDRLHVYDENGVPAAKDVIR